MLMSLTLSVKSNEPVDIWSIENKEEKKTTENTLDNDVQQSINNLTNSKDPRNWTNSEAYDAMKKQLPFSKCVQSTIKDESLKLWNI